MNPWEFRGNSMENLWTCDGLLTDPSLIGVEMPLNTQLGRGSGHGSVNSPSQVHGLWDYGIIDGMISGYIPVENTCRTRGKLMDNYQILRLASTFARQ